MLKPEIINYIMYIFILNIRIYIDDKTGNIFVIKIIINPFLELIK